MRPTRISILAFTAGVATLFARETGSSLIVVGQAVSWQVTMAMAVLTVGVSADVAALDTPIAQATIRRREGRR